MVSFLGHKNNAVSTIENAGGISSGATSVSIQSGDTSLFPSSGNFEVTLWPVGTSPSQANCEIVLVTAGQGTATFTITRAQESTTAKAFNQGDYIALLPTAKQLTDIENYLNGTTASPILKTPVLNVGSDATGDIYYRNAGGLFTRLPIGTSGQILGISGGIPSWATGGNGFQSGCSVSFSGTQSISASTDTQIQFNATDFDGLSEFNTSTYTFTATTTGRYLVTLTAWLLGQASGKEVVAKIYKNGGWYVGAATPSSGTNDNAASVSIVLQLSATETVSFYVFQNDTSSRNLNGGTYSHASIQRVF